MESSLYPWPAEVNGIERIALSAQGDLQRVLSAFFARPIVIASCIPTHPPGISPVHPEPLTQITPTIIASASPESPIVQTRQVHLQCNGKIVCTATSTEKYAIGQMFRRLEKVPAFELLSVGLGDVKEAEKSGSSSFKIASADRNSSQLWRKYTLVILEVFPAREMFIGAERWLTGDSASADNTSTLKQGLKMVVAGGILLMLLFEVLMHLGGRSRFC
ncbi:hypothetical protein BJ912DRAFT_950967 [Pholiota molesta]|nr:hypothetical protein BJ912DRAFT_950967 [Pholiota molesta]